MNMSIDEKEKRLKELEAESSYLYDLFTRAAHSRSGSILQRLCAVDKEISDLKKAIRAERRGTNNEIL